jgi:hypothetical protein
MNRVRYLSQMQHRKLALEKSAFGGKVARDKKAASVNFEPHN